MTGWFTRLVKLRDGDLDLRLGLESDLSHTYSDLRLDLRLVLKDLRLDLDLRFETCGQSLFFCVLHSGKVY